MHKKALGSLITVALFLPLALFAQVTVDTNTPPAETAPEDTMTEMTEEADTTPAELVSVAEVSVEPDSVTIAWTTDELTYGLIEYGKTSAYGSVTSEGTMAMMGHEQTISGLEPATTYHYRIRMRDEAGNISYSAPRSFATAAEPEVADEVSPTISNITISDITTSGASISFTADEPVRARLEYGVSPSYGSSLPFTEEYADTHTFSLTGLAEGTEYHFRIIAEDSAGNTTTTFDETFTTLAPEPPPEAALATSNVEVASVGTSTARIIWSTNKSADGQVFYGKTAAYGLVSALGAVGTAHSVTLSGLTPAAHYYFKVVSKTSAGETASSAGHEFNTLAQPVAPITPLPSISNVRIESVSTSSAAIRWTTNIAVPSKVEYGQTTVYGSVWQASAKVTEHYAPLQNLLASTTYHFRITARDSAGNTALSKDYRFTTSAVFSPLSPDSTSVSTSTATSAPSSSGTTSTSSISLTNSTSSPQASSPQAPSTVSTSSPQASSSQTGPADRDITKPNVKPLPTVAPVVPFTLGAMLPTPPIMPRLMKVEALDAQVMFVWLRNFSEKPNTQIRIIRKEDSPPRHRNDGETIFDGNGRSFTDTAVINGTTYHYAIFAHDIHNRFSQMMRISATPKAEKKEVVLRAKPLPVPLSPAFTFRKNLFAGSSDTDVMHLQALLSEYPKLYPEGQVTGYFGARSAQAVRRVQQKYNLPQTGIADARTRRHLETLSLVPRVAVSHSTPSAFSRDLSRGAKGEEVKKLQQFLADQSLYADEITGNFGLATRAALIRFQETHDIAPASGFFGPLTRERVNLLLKAGQIR